MSHHRRAVGAAVLLNTAISVGEAAAGYQANSLSLLIDSVHNLSDEMGLVALWLAFFVSHGPSRALVRSANIFNSVGLIGVSGVLLWEAVARFFHPVPVVGLVPIAVGLAAAAANWGVARLLLAPSEHNAAIRLAYIHNLGDVWVSLAPVLAGLLLIATGYPAFDPIIASIVAIWFVASTGREVLASSDELIWPDRIVCCHTQPEGAD
ncbi:MAG TPA: cation diffusion facilitator family transporter [Stellaceae bacterium]|nr:cation diffusion facilitator family transporter [Stellaceae bacterium]